MRRWIFLMMMVWCARAGADPATGRWDGLTPVTAGSTIEFQAPAGREKIRPLNLAPLVEPLFIFWLRPSTEAVPYLLVSAASQEAGERSLYVVRADGGLAPQRVTFPGRVLDPKSREVVHESHAFYGRCMAGQEHDALILYQRDRNDRKRRLQTSVYVAEAAPGMLRERLIERRMPSLSSLQDRVRRRQCKEVPGRNRLFDAAFFQLRNQRADLPDDDEDDEKSDEKNDETNGDKSEQEEKTSSSPDPSGLAPRSIGLEWLEHRANRLI